MNITIIGASAGVGLECVHRALARKHNVVALSRHMGAYPQHERFRYIQASATNSADLTTALTQAQAVLVTLGTGKILKSTTLFSDAARALIQWQQQTRSHSPVIVLTGYGAGDSLETYPWLSGLIFKFFLGRVYQDKSEMERLIAASTIHWEFVRPGILNNRPLSEWYRQETQYRKGMKIGSISRQDVADFMVKQAENSTQLGKYVSLSGK